MCKFIMTYTKVMMCLLGQRGAEEDARREIRDSMNDEKAQAAARRGHQRTACGVDGGNQGVGYIAAVGPSECITTK